MSDEPNRVLIRGFGVGNFRSFQRFVCLGPLTKINILAGINNSGKSNVADFLRRNVGPHKIKSDELDYPVSGSNTQTHQFAIALSFNDIIRYLAQKRNMANNEELRRNVIALFGDPAFDLNGDGLVWLTYDVTWDGSGNERTRNLRLAQQQASNVCTQQAARAAEQLSVALTNGAAIEDPAANAYQVGYILDALSDVPQIRTIEPARQIRPTDSLNDLIATIDKWQNFGPTRAERALEVKYKNLNEMVRYVLAAPNAEIRLSNARDSVLVRLSDDRMLPLENLGTGLHQLIRIAVMVTESDRCFICIEEPEVHMHPSMQRRLIAYLSRFTTNQYLITTHSSSILDQQQVSIFHVEESSSGTGISRAARPDDLVDLTHELGYRASDLFQSNTVIWVEGPSDRLYLNFWLELIDPDLVEGADYTIMYYGGQLLDYLSANPEEEFGETLEEFVRICTINRNFIVLADSDRKTAGSPLRAAKDRLATEADGYPNRMVWVTDGYTIENYVPRATLVQAVRKVHPRTELSWSGDLYENPLSGFSAKKIAIAREVVRLWRSSGEELFEPLRAKLESAATLIKRSSQQ